MKTIDNKTIKDSNKKLTKGEKIIICIGSLIFAGFAGLTCYGYIKNVDNIYNVLKQKEQSEMNKKNSNYNQKNYNNVLIK
jgi:hypothetical protein